MSQQAGGIGTRGPGETKLEIDRRRLLARVSRLEGELRKSPATRRTQGRARRRSRQRLVSLVGYTNAGKSTLLNRLTDAGALVEDSLFSTLDARTRRLALPGGETVLLSDTVGFVRKLPHQLVEAFRPTLEIVRDADLLLARRRRIVGRSREADRGRAGRCSKRSGPRACPGAPRGQQDGQGPGVAELRRGAPRDRSRCPHSDGIGIDERSCRRWVTGSGSRTG